LENSEDRAPCKKSPIPLSNDRFKIAEAHLGLSEEISGAATKCVELTGRDSSGLAVKQIANSLYRAVRGHQLGAGNWKIDRLHERNITIQELCEDPRIRAKKHGVIDVEANSGHGRAEAIFRGTNKGARIENAGGLDHVEVAYLGQKDCMTPTHRKGGQTWVDHDIPPRRLEPHVRGTNRGQCKERPHPAWGAKLMIKSGEISLCDVKLFAQRD